jgi:hypothetical protein
LSYIIVYRFRFVPVISLKKTTEKKVKISLKKKSKFMNEKKMVKVKNKQNRNGHKLLFYCNSNICHILQSEAPTLSLMEVAKEK